MNTPLARGALALRDALETGDATPSAATGYFAPKACVGHEMGQGHPECPARLGAIEDQMIASGLAGLVLAMEAPALRSADLERVHPRTYLDMLQSVQPGDGYAPLDPDTFMGSRTWPAVRAAAQAAVGATEAVLTGAARNAFCAIRPPGHHALAEQAMGFCFVNNVAVAARYALDVHGLERVAIVDFDVHHGNGTEAIFAGDARVLMVGFFQHPFYPYSGADGQSANMVNVPLAAGSDGAAVRAVVEQAWLPALERFRPEMIFISAGFDAHREDDLGQMRLVEADYTWLTEKILDVAERTAHGRVVSCLEGGYNLSALGRSVVAHVRALLAG